MQLALGRNQKLITKGLPRRSDKIISVPSNKSKVKFGGGLLTSIYPLKLVAVFWLEIPQAIIAIMPNINPMLTTKLVTLNTNLREATPELFGFEFTMLINHLKCMIKGFDIN